jgi:hypothetical protein
MPKTLPDLPPPPGDIELIYGQDPITGALTAEPVGARGAVSVPMNRLWEYLKAYDLTPDRTLAGGPVREMAGMGWTLFVRRVT